MDKTSDAAGESRKAYSWRSNARNYKPKVRSGCRTCKIRRIKCDEQKPDCLKCRSTGRKCDGYGEHSSNDNSETASVRSSRPDIVIAATPSSRIFGDPLGLSALRFFQSQTIPQLCGFFASDLWCHYVLQLSLLEPSLYYATVALGALHRWLGFDESGESSNAECFIFRQYNRAIQHLVNPIRPLSKVIVVVACYVFSSIEALYGDYISSFRHVSSGIKLLCDADSTTTPNTYPRKLSIDPSVSEEKAIEEKLLGHFAHLDLQAASFNPEWIPLMADEIATWEIPQSFSTLEEAKRLLTPLMLQTMKYMRRGRSVKTQLFEMSNAVRTQLLDQFQRWSAVMELWLFENRASSNEQQARRSAWLRIVWTTGYIMLSVPVAAEEIMYDEHIDRFRDIVNLASSLGPSRDVGHGLQTLISHEVGLLPALYLTGTKCRDPLIRRQALSLLTSTRKKEGVWDSRAAAKVVERVMALEENGVSIRACSDLPEKNRIRNTWLQAPSNAGRRAPVIMTRRSQPDSKTEKIVENIAW
ncbi:hypothetical protein LTS15_011250 [Exophiala xenobiotica]|nr:hypothetical protein LTS15_011250 [Exophiala xenobiotica]